MPNPFAAPRIGAVFSGSQRRSQATRAGAITISANDHLETQRFCAVIDRGAEVYADADQDRLDGLTVDCGDWWFNLRPSNTEPLLRLNLEAADAGAVTERVSEVTTHIAG